jgi:single-stranded-DNA-specific exonuclease
LRLSPITAQLLLNRGLIAPPDARRFLDAPLAGLHAPELLPGVSEAAERIFDAVRQGRRMCVYGDYDVDGTTGASILIQCLRLLGAEPDFYVPHRLDEGYGLNCEALRQIAADGGSLVVTVDCGIASLKEAEEAKRLGLELVVTDHHEYKETLPDAAVLVHPRLPGGSYPFGGLSGSAVALKLAWALAQKASDGPKVLPRFREFLLDAVALASLGVVADVVPLLDENRILVRYGLNRLRQTPSVGLKALCEAAGLDGSAEIRAEDIAFKIAPRLNAAGRLGCARLVVDLLTTTQRDKAVEIARYLELQNGQRQTLERRMLLDARKMIEETGRQDDAALVLASADWHGGVIGIIAGRLAEQYARPALMIKLPAPDVVGAHAGLAVGSGRSVAGFALHEALKACDGLLVGHGGHPAAAGFRLLPEHIEAFRERFCAITAANRPAGPVPTELVLDAEAPLSALTMGLLRDLDRLEPYGAANRRPMFLLGGLQVQGTPRKVGGGERHLSFRVSQHGVTLKAIAFGMADRVEELTSVGGVCCLACTPKVNEWQGRRTIDLHVTDFQAGPEARLT